ncbi:MAG: T9SS type A sorting domain-containing protein [Bacteroidetes bacterium]|nr:T9SS type A sorting domain-containing protein [Bacteroidota bacterium]
MKKIYFLLCSLSFFYVHSQSWCTPGSTWYYSTMPGSSGYTKYTYLSDTLVGANLCQKIKHEAHGVGMGGYVFDISDYIYTYEQSGIVFKNNGTLNAPQYDTLYNFTGAVGTKWRSNPSSGQACGQSYIEITGSGSMVIQGQTLNYKTVAYTNYFYIAPQMSPPQTGVDTLFERIGTRHQMEFITGYNCADITDAGPVSFRCFSDNQINFQGSSVACNYITTGIKPIQTEKSIEVNNPVSDVIRVTIRNTADKDVKHVLLIDQLGNKVYDRFVSENEFSISAQNLSNGLYILQVSSGKDVLNRKLIVQK